MYCKPMKLTISLILLFLTNTLNSFGKDSDILLDGYMDQASYNNGEKACIYLNAMQEKKITVYLVDVNNEVVDSVSIFVFQQHVSKVNPYVNGFGYKPTFFYRVPKLKSGLYRWQDTDIYFIIKNKSKQSEIVIVYPSNTEQAYNNIGGKSLYDFNSIEEKKTHTVSFQRPLNIKPGDEIDNRNYVIGFLRWISKISYTYKLIADVDLDNYSEIKDAKLLIIIGHSEYWTRQARLNFDQFVNSGKNSLILSGNTMWWQVRYNKDKTQLTCYKNKQQDTILNPLLKTINWTDISLEYPVINSIGAQFTYGGYGEKLDNGWDGYKIINDKSPILLNTGLKIEDILPCPSYEFDGTAIVERSYYQGIPKLDTSNLDFFKIELIAYDIGKFYLATKQSAVMPLIAFQKTSQSGKIINVCSTDWCSPYMFEGPSKNKVIQITSNMINLLLGDQSIFSSDSQSILTGNIQNLNNR